MKDGDLLRLIVLEDLEVLLLKRRDRRAAAVSHGGEDVHQLYIHFEGCGGLFALARILLLLLLLRLVGRMSDCRRVLLRDGVRRVWDGILRERTCRTEQEVGPPRQQRAVERSD